MANETVNGLKVYVRIEGSVVGADGTSQRVDITYERSFTDGTGTNQIGAWFYDETRAIAQAGEDVDLNGSTSYKSFNGVALDLTSLGIVYLENLDTDTGDKVTMTQPASNGASGLFKAAGDGADVGPGGLLLWVSPIDKGTVTASTADLINLAAADASGSNVKLLIAGGNA